MKKFFPSLFVRNRGRRPQILLGQLNSNGDCIYATTVARQIKRDYPGCHLTWAIGSMCRSIIDENPYVDDVWEVALNCVEDVARVWPKFAQEAAEKKRQGLFDEVFLTQIAPGNLHHYCGSIRKSIYRGYPGQITVPVTPVLRLTETEVEKVRRFADLHRLSKKASVILFESSPKTGQSFVTPELALDVAREVVERFPDSCVIISSNIPFDSFDKRIVDGSVLSLRENAELTKYCTLLIGSSSGISWVCTSDWAKRLPMVQLLNTNAIWCNSVVRDHKQVGLQTDEIIEMAECSVGKICGCIAAIRIDGFQKAKTDYHDDVEMPLFYYIPIFQMLISQRQYLRAIEFLIANSRETRTYRLLAHFLIRRGFGIFA